MQEVFDVIFCNIDKTLSNVELIVSVIHLHTFCLYGLSIAKLSELVEDQNGDRVYPVYTYTAYVSERNVKRSPFLYILSMGKLLVISRGPKWRLSFSRTCLYSVCEREKGHNISIFV